jgi:hypothetical protein
MGVLRNPKHEQFARERSFLTAPLVAARAAGYVKMTAGNAAKLDRNPKIRARIAELSKDDEDLVALKRRYLERLLMRVASADALDVWEPVIGANGKPTPGKYRLKDLLSLPDDLRQAVASVTIDGAKVKVEMLDKLTATAQLQKLWAQALGVQPDEGGGLVANFAMLQLVNNYENMSETEIARRIAFALQAGTRQIEQTPAQPAAEGATP